MIVPREYSTPKTWAPVSAWVSKCTRPNGPWTTAQPRICLGDRVVATEDHGERARGQDLPHGLLDGGVGASRVGRDDRGVAEVENPQLSERVDACLEVRTGRAARRADRARCEAGARPVGDELIHRGAHDHDVHAPEVGWVLRVRHAAVGKWTRVVGLLADPRSAAERV